MQKYLWRLHISSANMLFFFDIYGINMFAELLISCVQLWSIIFHKASNFDWTVGVFCTHICNLYCIMYIYIKLDNKF